MNAIDFINPFTPEVNYGDMWCSANFWVCGQNPVAWPFKWNLFGSTFAGYSLFWGIWKNNKIKHYLKFLFWPLLGVKGLSKCMR